MTKVSQLMLYQPHNILSDSICSSICIYDLLLQKENTFSTIQRAVCVKTKLIGKTLETVAK